MPDDQSTLPPALAAAMADDAPVVAPKDLVAQAHAIAARIRAGDLYVADLEERTLAAKKVLTDLRQRQLPEVMTQARMDKFGLPPDDNLPAFDVSLQTLYTTSYRADTPPEDRERLHEWLSRNDHGDMIRETVTFTFGVGQEAAIKKLVSWARRAKIDDVMTRKRGVHVQTLQAFIREQIEKYRAALPLKVLLCTVLVHAKVEQRRERKVVER